LGIHYDHYNIIFPLNAGIQSNWKHKPHHTLNDSRTILSLRPRFDMSKKHQKQIPLWHSISANETYSAFGSGELGLTQAEAKQRLTTYGANQLTPSTSRGPLKRFLTQFHNVLIYLLLAASVITYAIGERIDSYVILGVVIINALIGYIQEGKAEKALNSIRKLLTQQAMVRRDGKNLLIPSEQLVPGDVISLESGDKVPADIRLIHTKSLRIDESMLTGESVPLEKNIQSVDAHATLGDRFSMAYSGTLVTYGTGLGMVVATGDATEIGRINKLLISVSPLVTPLLRQIAEFSRWLVLIILAVAVATFVYGWSIQHSSPTELFMAVVSLAVAAIPEGLPAVLTITLAIGVQQMARQNAIIRRLPAVETLGSVTVICTDKTGTLTRNEMTVKSVFANDSLFTLEGDGYDPQKGCIKLDGAEINVKNYPDLRRLIEVAALCNNASVIKSSGVWIHQGDPTEAALITLALKTGIAMDSLKSTLPRTDTIPFESAHSFMATLHHDQETSYILVKGAPEQIFIRCSHQLARGLKIPIDLEECSRQIYKLAASGQRIIAVALKPQPITQNQVLFEDVESELTLLGIIGMVDPPRAEALQAVSKCQNAGIRIKMITGDHAVTALSIAEQMAIGNGTVLRGEDLDKMSDSELQQAVNTVDVFARASPENKLRLVMALQANHHIVAMTGDGVNDAPALKCADVGIAMGQKGTEVAKEASEMVLADDNFASIAKAVEEGRGIYDNIKKAIIFILPTSTAQALMIVVAILLGNILPITPVQILWINMVTAITLALALAFEPPESKVMKRLPRKPDEPLLSGFLVWRIVFVSVIMVGGTYGLFLWEQSQSTSIPAARTVAVNTLVMLEIFYVFNSRYLLNSVLNLHGLFGNWLIWLAVAILIVAQLGLTYWPLMHLLFGTESLDLHTWRNITATGACLFALVEIEKLLIRSVLFKFSKAKKTGN
jgi:magnesium-transporting ATPase (P-type)